MRVDSDSRGIAHVVVIGLIAITVVAVGFAGWRVMENNKDNKESTNSSSVSRANNKEIEKECNKELKDEDFCKFAASYSLETSYKAGVTTTGADGTSLIEMEVDSKGNSSITTQQGDKVVGRFIVLDKTSYYQDVSSNTWYRLGPTKTETMEPNDITNDIKFDNKNLNDDKVAYQKIGKEKCGKTNCFKYRVIDKESLNTEQYIWFDDKDYQFRRWMTKEGAETSDITITYTSVNIVAPRPVKDFSNQGNSDMDATVQAAQEAMNTSEQ